MSVFNKLGSLLKAKGKKGYAGIWTDEHQFVEAARKTHESGYKDLEAISPYPLHGIDDAINIPRSYIPRVTFIFGITGGLFGLWFTW